MASRLTLHRRSTIGQGDRHRLHIRLRHQRSISRRLHTHRQALDTHQLLRHFHQPRRGTVRNRPPSVLHPLGIPLRVRRSVPPLHDVSLSYPLSGALLTCHCLDSPSTYCFYLCLSDVLTLVFTFSTYLACAYFASRYVDLEADYHISTCANVTVVSEIFANVTDGITRITKIL